MFFEDILILLLTGTTFFTVVLPTYRFINSIRVNKRNVVKEANEQLESAKAHLAAAKARLEAERLEKEAERIYDHMYEEVLEEDKQKENKR